MILAQAWPQFQTWQIGAAAAAVAIPTLLILYFLKLRRRNVEVSSTLLWKKSIQDYQANAPFQKLRRNILLLIQLLIILALLLAVSQPERHATASSSARNIILIDRSASMSTRDAKDENGQDTTRLERAKLEAINFVKSLRGGGLLKPGGSDEAMVIAFDRSAEVVQTLTSNKELLEQAIRSIEPTDAATNIDEALRLCAAYTRTETIEDGGVVKNPGPPIRLFSDGGIPTISDVGLAPQTSLTFQTVGAANTPNVGITAMRTERAYDRADDAAVFIAVQSTDPQPRRVDIQLEIDDKVAGVRQLSFKAAEKGQPVIDGVVFTITRPERALLTARVITNDPLPSDNVAQLVLPPAKRLAVAIVGQSSFFLRTALEGLPLAKVETLTPDQFTAYAKDDKLAEFDVIILDNWAPPAGATLPPGHYLAFGSVPPIEGLAHKPPPEGVGTQVILNWDREHPALRLAELDTIVIDSKAPALTIPQGARTIATSSAGPAIVDVTTPDVRAIVVSFNPAESDWPFKPGYVLFVGGAIRNLGNEGADLAGATSEPGATLATRLPPSARNVEMRLPDDRRLALQPAADGRVSFGPVRTAGLYTLTWDGPVGPQDVVLSDGRVARVLAVNILNPFESRVETRETVTLPTGTIVAANAGQSESVGVTMQRFWPWLIVAALLVMLLEWFVYHRRVHF